MQKGVSGVTHSAALRVVRSVGQDEGLDPQRTLAANGAEGRVPAAGQDHKEMCRDGSVIPGETRDHRIQETDAPLYRKPLLINHLCRKKNYILYKLVMFNPFIQNSYLWRISTTGLRSASLGMARPR